MNRRFPWSWFPLLLLGACGAEASPPAPQPPSPAVQQLLLAQDPGAALSVRDAKAGASKEPVVVQGRIANIVRGHAVFTLMDTGLPFCGETNKEDKCATPWDYCCETAAARTANSLVVEARDAQGKPLATPSLPDLRLLDVVKVKGTLGVDGHGNHVLVASGFFRAQRPELPAYVEWPQ
jgi:hypothetical protein